MIGTGVCIAALMAGIKDTRLMHATGLAGSCTVVEQLQDGSTIDACRAGKLWGRPDLSRRDCRGTGMRGAVQYWRCPEGTQAP
ncbi:MAG: hypothetical protein ABUS54_02580 [Actinomycetota bacterium]